MKDRIKNELERHNEFQQSVLGADATKTKVKDVDIRTYAKHILRNRPIEEKRELLANLRSKLTLNNKQVVIS